MIHYCSICHSSIRTKFQLDFEDLPGAYEKTYTQYIGICDKCGYIFTQNPFSDEQLNMRYKELSKFEYDANDYILDNKFKEQSLRQLHFLQENIDFGRMNSILEIGAASGYNLSLYTGLFKRVLGIEPSRKNCTLAKKLYNIEMYNGMFNEFIKTNPNEHFDIVFLSMILEHIVDPARFIEQCKQLCNKYIFIEIPILDLRHEEEPMGIFAEEHVSLFTIDSLYELMRRSGFGLVNAETIFGLRRYLPAAYPAIATLWEKSTEDSKPFRFNIFSSEEMLDQYISNSQAGLENVRRIIDSIPNDTKIAVWGVGHHAAMLLANTSLPQKRIVRVYDSDIRKHHLTFAGIKLSAFQVEDVLSGIVEAILLTTYTAQKAICEYLKRTVVTCKIYCLYDS